MGDKINSFRMPVCTNMSLSQVSKSTLASVPSSRQSRGIKGKRLVSRSAQGHGHVKFVTQCGKTADGPSLAIAGVTGAVGQEFIRVLEQRDFPYKSVKMLASKRSAGSKVQFDGEEYTIEELGADSWDDIDIALFSAGGSISKKFGPIAAEKGAVVVDNSSAFRMTEGVPLVVPEVNPEAMAGMKPGGGGIIAKPNCSTIICLMAATPLHRVVPVKRMVVSTYQAASGAGAAAMAELELQTREVIEGKPPTTTIFGRQY